MLPGGFLRGLDGEVQRVEVRVAFFGLPGEPLELLPGTFEIPLNIIEAVAGLDGRHVGFRVPVLRSPRFCLRSLVLRFGLGAYDV